MRRFTCLLVFLTTTYVNADEQTLACKAAFASVDYGDLLKIPDETKLLIESYRTDWKKFCGNLKSRPTLADLYAKAINIEKKFEPVLDVDWTAWKRNDPRLRLLDEKYPQFVPAFSGFFGEFTFFSPDRKEFRKNTSRGTDEDLQFFSSVVGSDKFVFFAPWLEAETDYGGCVKHGDFDWVGQLAGLVQLSESMKSQIYQQEISNFENRLFTQLTANRIYTCGEKSEVLIALKAIQGYLNKEPVLAQYLAKIQSTIKGIESGEQEIESRAENEERRWQE